MDQIDELKDLIGPALGHLEKDKADRIGQLLSRIAKTAALQEKKLNRAILDRQAVHSLMKKTSDDLMQRYRVIFEHAGNPMIVIEKDGTIALANTQFCGIIGETSMAVEHHRNICDYVAGGNYDPLMEGASPGVEQDTPENSAGRIHTPDGRTLDVLISIGSFPGTSQRIVTFVDITERLRLEQKLIETSNFLTGILKASPVGFHMTDPEGRLMYINDTWTTVTGYPSDTVMGKYYADIVHPDDRERVIADVRRNAGRGEPMNTETRIVRSDGTIRWIQGHAVPVRGPDGNLTGWVGAINDITERKIAEASLRKSEDQFRRIADSVPGVVYQFYARDNGEMGNTFVSRQSRTIFGIPEDPDRFFERFTACIPDDERDAFILSIHNAVSAAGRWEYAGRFVRPDGKEMIFRAISEPYRQPGELVYFGVLIDVTEIRKAQNALRQSEEKYRFLIENTGDVVYSLDRDRTITYISPQVRQIGSEPYELIGKNILEFVDPEDRKRVMQNNQDQARGGPHKILEFRIRNSFGKKFWVEVNGTIVRDPQGRPLGLQGVMRDVTARKQVEEELRKSEVRFREMADLLPQVIFEMDASGQLTYLNRFGLQMFGLTEDALLSGLDALSFLAPGDRDHARERLGHIASGAAGTKEIYTLRNGSGEVLLAYIHAAPIIRDGIPRGFRGSVIDITELKRVEAALREREEMFRALTENIPELIFSAGVDMRITYVSPQVRLFGFDAGDLLGKELFSIICPADREQVTEQFSRDLRENSRSSLVFRILDKSEDLHWVEQKVTLIRDEKGIPLTVFGILHDITERKKAEAAIELANRKLNLMNNITRHDILNTVTGTLGCIDMLRAGGGQEEKDQLLTDIKELVRVIQRQITFTREYQEVGIRMPQWQNLRAVIATVRRNFEKPPFAILVRVEDVELYADPLFEKVIYNLIDNAVRYAETATELTFTSRRSGRTLVLTCEDNGSGVPCDQKEHIFERGIGRNTGMGLFLTREILEITGISISETGTPGEGARFEIRIPQGNFRVTEPEQ
jgi:PAS domain S-box-containing protein